MKALGVIPARYGSTRLAAKALANLNGAPLIQHVYQQAKKARRLSAVVVATDDTRIMEAVSCFGGQAVMTNPNHRSGTDRVAEVARGREEQVILNIQGDEPLIHPEQIDAVAAFLLDHRAVPMATIMTPLARREDAANPNVVKVVVDQDGYALYFSRSPIPYVRTQEGSKVEGRRSRQEEILLPSAFHPPPSTCFWKHIGLYGYQREFLLRFPHLAPTPLEQAESLEQLRALEHGFKIRVLESAHDTVGVDTPDDLARVEALLAKSSSKLKVER